MTTIQLNSNEEYRPHCTDACRGTRCPCWTRRCEARVRFRVPRDPDGFPLFGAPPHPAEFLPHLCEISPFGPCR